MNQFKLDMYWRINKTVVRSGLSLFGVGCTATSEVETITTLRETWVRAKGMHRWRRMKPFAGNL